MSAHGKTLRSQAQQFVLDLLEYNQKEKENNGPLLPLSSVQERVADGLKISVSTVKRIKARSAHNPILSSPGKKRPRKKTKTEDISEAVKMNIRNTVYTMYSQKKHVTVKSLNDELRENGIILSNSSVNRVLHCIGFKFKKDSNRRALIEKPHIAEMRLQFLRSYIENMNSLSPKPVVFLDETWIFSKGNAKRSWQDDDVRSVRKPEGYEGKRFIVVHAGSKSGFVPNASLLFASKSQKGDYHGEMDGKNFLSWVTNKLSNNLQEPSIIVMDNAPYHSTLVEKMPSSSWNKADIAAYLTKNNIPFDSSLFKTELLTLAKHHRKEKKFQTDEILKNKGHTVVRLPPYHCDFNAIEMIWAHAKSYYDKHIGRDGYGDEKVYAMWNEALDQCTEEIWRKCVIYTENLIKEWYEREKILDIRVDELIIPLGDDSSSSSEFDSDSDSN